MQEFVGESIAQGFQDFLRILTLGQKLAGTLQFVTPVSLCLIAQGPYGGHDLTRFQPVHEVDHIGVNDCLSLSNSALARRAKRVPSSRCADSIVIVFVTSGDDLFVYTDAP